MLRRNFQPDHVVPTMSIKEKGIDSSTTPTSSTESQSSLATFTSNYLNLRHDLKSCLDYCYFLTKVCDRKDTLVRLLVAEDMIIQDDHSCNMVEDIASSLIEELISLEMLYNYPLDPKFVKVSSLYQELRISDVADLKNNVAEDANSPIHLYVLDDGRDNLPPNLSSLQIKSLFVRAALYRSFCHYPEGRLSRVFLEIICKLKTLTVLDLNGYIECLPDEIGDLIHLKYLRLFESHLQELPRSIVKLQKLQTLIMILCKLRELPVEIFGIQQLRHLIMSRWNDKSNIRVPRKIRTMKNLQTLCGVYAGGGIAKVLSELTQLRQLKVLRVSEDHATDLFAAISKMTNLVSLSMEAEKTYIQEEEEERSHEVALFPEMETFSSPCLLQEVHLRGQLIEMPSWLVSMENLTKLRLSDSYLPDYPTLKIQFLPKLKHLYLCEASTTKLIGKEFCSTGGFPELKTLEISSTFLVEWTEIVNGSFPRLKSLAFRECTNFKFFPNGFQNVSTLRELWVFPMYHEDLKRRLQGEEKYKIENITDVRLMSLYQFFRPPPYNNEEGMIRVDRI